MAHSNQQVPVSSSMTLMLFSEKRRMTVVPSDSEKRIPPKSYTLYGKTLLCEYRARAPAQSSCLPLSERQHEATRLSKPRSSRAFRPPLGEGIRRWTRSHERVSPILDVVTAGAHPPISSCLESAAVGAGEGVNPPRVLPPVQTIHRFIRPRSANKLRHGTFGARDHELSRISSSTVVAMPRAVRIELVR